MKTIRIFISSTFSDMHAERDYLVRTVFPELKEKCRKLRVHLVDVDLRWGVTEKDAQEGKALDICLDEIDSCRPYFIGLLGQRYGHIPGGHHHSITAQEIFHGVLHNELPKQIVDLRSIIEGRFEGRRLSNEQIETLVKCYDLQDRKYVLKENISPEDEKIIRSVFAQFSAYQRDRSFFFFRKEMLSLELAEDKFSDFFDEEQEDCGKLTALKQEIIKEDLPHFEYDTIEKFGELVRDTLWSHIEKEIGEAPEVGKDWLTQEDELHDLFMADRKRRFVGRHDLLGRMHAFCRGDSRIAQCGDVQSNIVVITGEPGCGKSALMARFTEEFMREHPGLIVIPHFVGASPNSTSLRLMLRRLCLSLNKKIGSNEEVPEDIKELLKIFPETLKKAADQRKDVGANGRSPLQIVIILDAVNQLEKTDNAHSMYWLPQDLPDNVRFVISTLAGDAHDALMRRRIRPVEEIVHGLNPSDITQLVLEYLEEVRKEFPNENIKRAFFEKVKSGNPLYILVALEELRIFPKFEEVGSRVDELPGNVPALFDQVLQRIEGDFNPELVKDMMSYIACGRYGMTAEELQALLRNHAPMVRQAHHDKPCHPELVEGDSRQAGMTELAKLPDMLWARLYRAFSAYLFERSGVIDFFHGQLKEAVGTRYFKEETSRDKVHKIIADYFETRWQEPYARALDELPHQQVKAKMWNEVEKTLTTFMFLQRKIEAFGPLPLIEDYNVALKSGSVFSDESRRSIDLIRGAIQLSSHVLTKDRTQLASQLWGRLTSLNESVIIGVLLQTLEGQQIPWLRSSTQSLILPGGPLIHTLGEHGGGVTCVAIIPDCSRVISASLDTTLKLWDIESGMELLTLRGHRDGLTSVAITQNGNLAISAAGDIGLLDNTLKVWDIESGRELRTLKGHSRSVNAVAITPDGRRAISASSDETLKVWDIESGRELRTLKGHSESVKAVAITPDGRFAVSGSNDNTLKVWDIESGRELRTLQGHSNCVFSAAITPDGRFAVSGSNDNTLKVWDIESGRELRTLQGHSNCVFSAAITPDGNRAVSASADRTLKVWDIESGSELCTLQGHSNCVFSAAITPDGSRAVSASADRTLKVWDIESRIDCRMLEGHSNSVNSVAITPNGSIVVSASDDKTLKVWDICSGKELYTLEGHSSVVKSAAITPDGRLAISASWDKTVKIWDIKSGKELRTLQGHSDSVYSIAITPEGQRAVSASHDQTLKIWDIYSGRELYTLKGHGYWVELVAITPDGSRVVSASGTALKVWDLKNGNEMHTLKSNSGGIKSVAITPDSSRIVAAAGNTLKVWDIKSGKELHTLEGHSNWVLSVAINRDGRRAVSASAASASGDTLKIWDIINGKDLCTLRGHLFPVKAVAITSDSSLLVSASVDKKIKVWDMNKRNLLTTFWGEAEMSCCIFTPDGRTIVAGDASGRVHFLKLEGFGEGEEEFRSQDSESRSQEKKTENKAGGGRKKRWWEGWKKKDGS